MWKDVLGRRLDVEVLGNLVDCMYGSFRAVLLSVVGYVLMAVGSDWLTQDRSLLVVCLVGISLGLVRCCVALAYGRLRRGGPLNRRQLEASQIVYAVAGASYAAVIGLTTARAAFVGDPYVFGMFLVFTVGYAQGLLIYVAVRPMIALCMCLLPLLVILSAVLATGIPAYQATCPLFFLSMFSCLAACRQQSANVIELYQARHRLNHEVSTDELTGLCNRRGFDQAIERVSNLEMAAVCYLDLDGFKNVNDGFGHEAGDDLLRDVAKQIRSVLEPNDSVARIGGDEFVVLLRGDRALHCHRMASQLRQAIAGRYEVCETTVDIDVSIGVAEGIAGVKTIEQIVRDADYSMYSAKKAGRGRIHTGRAMNFVDDLKAASGVGDMGMRSLARETLHPFAIARSG